jgi:queuosine precursor transporter
MKREYRILVPITALFVATLLIANTLDTKIFHVVGLDLPAGIIIFPLAYVFGDVLTEVYGYSIARRTIWTGFLALALMVGAYEIARALPPADFWPNQQAFDAIFSHVPRIVAASILAYFCGEFVNSYIVAKMKVMQSGKNMGLRFVTSTIAGQAIDTAVFIIVAFGGVMPAAALISVFVSAWLVKVAWEVVALPITIPFVRMLKRIENEDAFDRDTNFNPFRFG